MAFRILYLEHQARLSKKYGCLRIMTGGHQYSVPFSDIECLILDNLHCSITTNVINTLSIYNVAVLVSDIHHLPSTIILPCNRHFIRLPIIKKQFSLHNRTRARLWQKIIKRKILNEELTLKFTKKSFQDIDVVRRNVALYDRKHCEAIAAKIYFERLFGKSFTRRDASTINAALNYGYSLIRSLIARDICAYGLEPSLGIWHSNNQNAFNLADDLIEPFRSTVICSYISTGIDY